MSCTVHFPASVSQIIITVMMTMRYQFIPKFLQEIWPKIVYILEKIMKCIRMLLSI